MKCYACTTQPHTTDAGRNRLCVAGSCTKAAVGYDGKGLFPIRRMSVLPGSWASARIGVPDARSMCALA